MPTIMFSYKDFQQLLGRKLEIDKFEELLLLYAKAEVESYDKRTGEIAVKLDDTNLPYLWCPEGLARFFKGILGHTKGISQLKANSSNYKIAVDDSVKNVRPYITAFVAKGAKLDDYLLKQLVQLQEKFCEGYGRKRQKVSIGLYSYKRISFPVHYKAVAPASVKFVPLEFDRKLNLNEILVQHPKGQQYGWILKGFSNYPLLLDSKGEILSFPPIINSNFTGKLEANDSELLFEATGTDEESINLAASIFAQNLQERGFSIYSVTVSYKGRTVIAPATNKERVKISAKEVEELIGLKLKELEIKSLLLKVGYDVVDGHAVVPPYRADIMHPVDVIEDVAIAYGFDRIAEEPLASYTVGAKDKSINTINSLRKAAVGMGFQEVFSHILTDKNSMIGGIGIDEKTAVAEAEKRIVELDNLMSETYSAVRNSLLPQLLDVLSKNKHADYPQKIFEEGIVVSRQGAKVIEAHSIALVSAHAKADFTEQKQHLTALLTAAGAKFTIQPAEHPAFLKGRAGTIVVGKTQIGSSRKSAVADCAVLPKQDLRLGPVAGKVTWKIVGVIGEISPAVLAKWGIEMPAAAIELNTDFLLTD